MAKDRRAKSSAAIKPSRHHDNGTVEFGVLLDHLHYLKAIYFGHHHIEQRDGEGRRRLGAPFQHFERRRPLPPPVRLGP